MSTLAPILQSFFTDRLHRQRQASTHTIAAYRDAIRLLVVYAADQTTKAPSDMDVADLDAPLIGAFLTHLCHRTPKGGHRRTGQRRPLRGKVGS